MFAHALHLIGMEFYVLLIVLAATALGAMVALGYFLEVRSAKKQQSSQRGRASDDRHDRSDRDLHHEEK